MTKSSKFIFPVLPFLVLIAAIDASYSRGRKSTCKCGIPKGCQPPTPANSTTYPLVGVNIVNLRNDEISAITHMLPEQVDIPNINYAMNGFYYPVSGVCNCTSGYPSLTKLFYSVGPNYNEPNGWGYQAFAAFCNGTSMAKFCVRTDDGQLWSSLSNDPDHFPLFYPYCHSYTVCYMYIDHYSKLRSKTNGTEWTSPNVGKRNELIKPFGPKYLRVSTVSCYGCDSLKKVKDKCNGEFYRTYIIPPHQPS